MIMKNTKTIKTILFVSLIAAMILPFSGMNFAEANQADNKDKSFDKVEKYDAKIKKQLAKSDEDRIHEKVKEDKKTSDLFKNKSVTSNGYSYFGNVYELEANPDKKLDIVLHYTVDGEAVTVLIDGETEEVIQFQVHGVQTGAIPSNGLIISGYTGVAIKGLRMDYTAPSFTPITGTGWEAMLVNAAKNGSVNADACNPTKVPTTYWAQSGIQMAQGGMDLIWADTSSSCIQAFFTSNPTEVDAGDSIISQITVTDSTDQWIIYGYNISNGNFWTHTKTVSGSTDFKVDATLTSVFFENPNHASQAWDPSYSTNPKITKAYGQKVSNGVWDYWGGQTNWVTNCKPGGFNWSGYASGALNTVGVTYDVDKIQQYCNVGP